MNNIVQAMTFKVYDFTLTAGGSFRLPAAGGYFRIMTSTGAVDVTVEGVGTLPGLLAGQALKNVNFPALLLRDASGAPNSGTILVASSEFQDNRLNGTVDLSATSLAALESVDLNAATQNALKRPEISTGSFSNTAALTANTPVTVFTPAANANGAIILSAGWQQGHASNMPGIVFLAKSSAPASISDGEVIGCATSISASASVLFGCGVLPKEVQLPAGLGLYVISQDALSAAAATQPNLRYCRYKLL